MSFGGVLANVILSPVDSFARDVRYMPLHLLHLLQLLNVGCFGPLKKAYGHKVNMLVRN
jgi:hypothetical protein